MGLQQITNPKGAFNYASSARPYNSRSAVTIRTLRNMSTVNTVTVGQTVAHSSLVGEGNEALPGTTVADGTQRILGIAVTSASTNTNTTNQSTAHPTGAWFDAVIYGPVEAFVTTAVEKGDVLTISASTVAPVSGGRLAALSTAGTTGGLVSIVGWALTSGTSGTTLPNGRVFVRPQFVVAPTS